MSGSLIAALAYIIIFSEVGMAETATNTMTVTATVANTCSFSSVTDTTFGTIDGLFLSNQSVSNGSVVVICTTGATYSLSLGPGNNLSGGNRRMASGANFITYQLYSDMSQTTLWGDGTAGIGNALTGLTGSGATQAYTVYARIPTTPQTAAPAGAYTDTVTITITF